MTEKRLTPHEAVMAHIREHGEQIADDVLDELVHSLKSREASNINNEGFTAQVEYAIQSAMTCEEIIEEIKKATADNARQEGHPT